MNPIHTARRERRAGPTFRLSRAALRTGTAGQPRNHAAPQAGQPKTPRMPAVQSTGHPERIEHHLDAITAPGQTGGQAR